MARSLGGCGTSGGGGDDDLKCEGYEQPNAEAGSSTVVACDQTLLSEFIETAVQKPDADPRLVTGDPRFTVSAGAVAVASGPAGASPSDVTILVGASGSVRVFAADAGAQLAFGRIVAPAGTALHVTTPSRGSWEVRDDAGRVLASAVPKRPSPKLRLVSRLTAHRNGRLVRVSFLADEPPGARFRIDTSRRAGGRGHAKRVIGRHRAHRYVAHLRARAGDRYARVVVERRGRRIPPQVVEIR